MEGPGKSYLKEGARPLFIPNGLLLWNFTLASPLLGNLFL